MKVIEVIPNPYIALDKDGIPQGVVGAGMPGIYVGAQIDSVASVKSGKARFFFPLNKKAEKGKEQIVRVQFTAEFVASVLAGELIAATKESAKLCGISEKDYLEPALALAAEKAKALAYYKSAKHTDEKSVDLVDVKLGDIPREPTPTDDEAEKAKVEAASSEKKLGGNLKLKTEG